MIGRQSYTFDLDPDNVPPRDLPRPHLRMHERRGAALERRFCARRLVREFGGVRRNPPAQYRRAALQPTNSSATRCSTWSAISRWRALPLLGAYRSVRGGHKLNHAVLTALMADRSAYGWSRPKRPAVRAVAESAAAWWRHGRPGLRPRRVLTRPAGRLADASISQRPDWLSGSDFADAARGSRIFRANHDRPQSGPAALIRAKWLRIRLVDGLFSAK